MKYIVLVFSLFFVFFKPTLSKTDTVTVALNALPELKSELIHTRSINKMQVLKHIYESIFQMDANYTLKSHYLLKWEVKEKGKLYIFYPRKDIKFSDGSSININHIKNSISRKLNNRFILKNLKDININRNSITVKLSKSNYSLPEILSGLSYSIIKNENSVNLPIGSGAFQFKNSKENIITLTRNIYHRDLNIGSIKNLKFRKLDFITSPISLMKEMKIDFFPFMKILPETDTQTSKINNHEGFTSRIYPSHRVNVLVLNIKDMLVRDAIHVCLDKSILRGLNKFKTGFLKYNSIIPRGLENYNPIANNELVQKKDLCEDKLNLLKKHTQSGVKLKDSFKNKLKTKTQLKWVNIYTDPEDIRIINNYVKYLNNKIQIVKIKLVHSTLTDAINLVKSGKHNIFLCGLAPSYPLAESIFSDFIYEKGDRIKLLSFKTQKLQKLRERYFSTQDANRLANIRHIEDYLIENRYVLPLLTSINTYLIPTNWKNIQLINAMNGNFYLGKVVFTNVFEK